MLSQLDPCGVAAVDAWLQLALAAAAKIQPENGAK
jgi:hypothetical protein